MNDPYPIPWRNGWARSLYYQVCKPDELAVFNPKLLKILDRHGTAFDDYCWYFFNIKKTYVRRCPLWLAQKRVDAEKPKRGRQLKLPEIKARRGDAHERDP